MATLKRALLAACLLLVLPLGFAGAAASKSVFAPTPTGPVYGGVPGALPPHFAYAYDSSYRGWPVAPTHVQHPVRGAFLDPRGLDDTGSVRLPLRHRRERRRQPPGGRRAGRLLAPCVRGRVGTGQRCRLKDATRPCLTRRLQVGHFAYWHVSPDRRGTRLRQGGRADRLVVPRCVARARLGVAAFRGRQVWVNPLHRGGRIAPYVDTAAPVVNALVFVTPPARPWLPTKSLAQQDTSTRLRRAGCTGSSSCARTSATRSRSSASSPTSGHGRPCSRPIASA